VRRNKHGRNQLFRWSVAFWLTIIASLTLSGLFNIALVNILASIVMLLCIYTIPMRLEPQLRAEAFHPWSFYILNNIVQYGFSALLVLFSIVEDEYMENYALSVLLIGFAFLAFWLGWHIRLGKRLSETVPLLVFPKRGSGAKSRAVWPTVVALYSMGWIGRLARASAGFSHLPNEDVNWQSGSVLGIVSSFATLSFLLILYLLLSDKKKGVTKYILVVAIVTLEVVGGSIDGGRTAMVMPLLYFLMVYHFTVKHIRWRTIMAGYVLAFLILAPLLTWYRASYYKALETQAPGLDAVVSVLGTERDKNIHTDWFPTLEENIFEGRTAIFRSTQRVIGTVPEVNEYQLGDTFIRPMTTLIIPRALWPDKPIYTPGRDFAIRFWQLDTHKVLGTSMPLGMPAEAYFNFGWLGLFMFPLLGLMLRFTYERYLQYRELETFPIIRVFFLILSVGNSDNAFLYYFAEIVRGGATYLVFLALINWQLPRLTKPLRLQSDDTRQTAGPRPARRLGWAMSVGRGEDLVPAPAKQDA
jgi:hypothetical protein